MPRRSPPRPTSPRLLALALSCCAVAWAPPPAAAQDGPVTRHIRGRHDEVNRILRSDPAGPARNAAVGAIIDDLIDFDAMSRSALGAHWGEMSAAQQTEFVSLLRELTRNRYLDSLEHILDFEVEYRSETAVSGGTSVSTTARSRVERRSEPVEIVYSMHSVGGTWRVFDVTTDGVSMISNYRRQFHSIISEHGVEGLLQRMRDRRAREAH